MARYYLVAALLYLQIISGAALAGGGQAKTGSCAALLPAEAKCELKTAYPDWMVLEHDQLYPHQQEIWGRKCPGVAIGQFRGPGESSYAVVIVRRTNGTKQAKLLLLEKHKTDFRTKILREQNEVPSYPVVHKEPPGVYREFYDRANTVSVTNDAFVYEHLEATATLFYYKDGRYHELLISD